MNRLGEKTLDEIRAQIDGLLSMSKSKLVIAFDRCDDKGLTLTITTKLQSQGEGVNRVACSISFTTEKYKQDVENVIDEDQMSISFETGEVIE